MNLPPCDHDEYGPVKCKRQSEKPPSTAQLTRLIRSMLRSLDLLGRDHMARVDARILAERYRKRAARIGVRKLL